MKIALITLSKEGADLVRRLAKSLPDADLFMHEGSAAPPREGEAAEGSREAGSLLRERESVGTVHEKHRAQPEAGGEKTGRVRTFSSIISLTQEIFSRYHALVFAAPCGVVVRALATSLQHKGTDPAVVVLDVGGRFAVSLLSGHEGGANDLAVTVANIVGAEPVITTTTEALKTVIVGVGCRRGAEAGKIVEAIVEALREAGAALQEVRLLASAEIKMKEDGLLLAARKLGIPLRFIPSEDICSSTMAFDRSDFVEEKVSLPAVAEPAALLAGRRTRLILPKRIFNGVTVAVARESFSWLESVQGDR